ncbi:LPS-assembly protein LptD [Sphingomonas tabacisoli]|uniref:LPS-assembly protein LptD n=1 Tax=Sphingomonas tabacisoli TaxID=2249466 RepID=A0ABW4I2E7_9SPHN
MNAKRLIWLTSVACCWSAAASAQDLQNRPVAPPPPQANPAPAPADQQVVDFTADQLEYFNETDTVVASGDVRMFREGNRLRAAKVTWNRKTGEVRAEGNVAVANPQGDVAYGDSVQLTDTLRDGVVQNLLIVLQSGGRLAADKGARSGDVYTLDNAAYTACSVVDSSGCPKEPSWKITAVKVVYDTKRQRVFYKGARLHLFGLPTLPLPLLSNPTGNQGGSGVLVPDIKFSRVNGLEFVLPYYFQIAPNRDLTLTPHIYSDVLPAIEAQYRALTSTGAYQISGMITDSRKQPATINPGTTSDRSLRGYLDASGRFQLDPNWDISGSIRLTTDRTFLRRYDISRDDRLRSTIRVQRIGDDSYFSVTGWATQTLRINDSQGQQPIAVPEVDYRRRFNDPLLGGRVEVQLNTLAIGRTDGQDTQRAFASFRWDLRRLTPWGQEVTFTAFGRGDVYHSDENALSPTVLYRGNPGWQSRAIGALAVDIRWPLIGSVGDSGTQRITPRLQFVATPPIRNLAIPNEDARAIELEDSNLFALNRFPGYDRFEDGARVTYGVDYGLALPGITVDANIGQSYRLSRRPEIFPNGVGLSGRLSDIVGRTTVRFRDFVSVTHRYRIDKDSFALRRNEIDATIGSRQTYVLLGYLKLNRDIDTSIEDLRDREELRAGGRVQIGRYWSAFGSAIIDLTDKKEDPLSTADGFQPIRHRIGIAYTDDCLDLGLTWRRDYQNTGDARKGNTFLLRLSFKNLGR